MPAPTSLEELKEQIELFLLEQLRPLLSEPGKDVVDLSVSSYSLTLQHNKLLWHVWNEYTNLVRQITSVAGAKHGRLELRYQRFGKGPAGKLVLADSRASSDQLDRRTRRTQYTRRLQRWLHQLFPLWKVRDLSTEPDLARSFSGRYARCWLVRGQQAWAVIGSGETEDGTISDDCLTYGLLWLEWLRQKHSSHVFEGLRTFLPQGTSEITRQRMAWLNPRVGKWKLFETGVGNGDEVRQCDAADLGNLRTTLARLATLQPVSKQAGEMAVAISAASPAIEVRYGADGLRCWSVYGLAIARETSGGIVFGLGRAATTLRSENLEELRVLARRVADIRRPEARDVTHPLYRLQPERWMQSVVSRQLQQLSANLIADNVYEQVPAISGTARGVLDLLAVTA